jgi:hypothetical protein
MTCRRLVEKEGQERKSRVKLTTISDDEHLEQRIVVNFCLVVHRYNLVLELIDQILGILLHYFI